jgi:phosphoglycolate phosphatase
LQVATLVSGSDNQSLSPPRAFVRPGFRWHAADAFLFDIDGTLLNSRDPVHYFAFHHALLEVFGLKTKIDGVPVHGNTDIGILRAVLRREGLADAQIDSGLPQMVEEMCREAERNADQMEPELCPSIYELVSGLHKQGKLLVAASGNLEAIAWLKLEKAGLKSMFSLGSFSFPLERRADIFLHGIELARQRLGNRATVHVVGDTLADIEAAKEIGVPIIAVATGIYSFEDLLALDPDASFGCGTDMLAHA